MASGELPVGYFRQILIAGTLLLGFCSLMACSVKESPQGSLAPLPPSSDLRLELISTSLSAPVFMTAPPNDPTRLFIVEQGGLIRIFDIATGSLLGAPFLNISGSGLISTGGERGLLGMAFDAQYASNRQFYVFYTGPAGDIVIARYLRHLTIPNLVDASPGSITVLLTVPHPLSNHNGGMLAFGPDGCLYAGIGDGGGGDDPDNNGQNLNTRLGKVLRINPLNSGPCTNSIPNPFVGGTATPEVWSYGLRNPWRFSFDRLTNDFYIADVGQNAREEIDVSVAPNAGRQANYGWRLMEGFLCFIPSTNCDSGALTLPVLDYAHLSGACSVTGGYVYRGSVAPALQGTYFYADYCAGFVRSFRFQNGQATNELEWPMLSPPGGFITSFGEDAQGELYLVSQGQGGGLFKIVPN